MTVDGSDFTVTGRTAGGRVTVVATGEVDLSTAGQMLQAATPAGARAATVDLSAVTFFDSAAILALVRLAERYPDALEVIPSQQVLRVLDISGLSGQPWLRSRPAD